MVDAKAEKGEEFLLSMLDMDEGSRFVGEIAIGTNDRVKDVTGNILLMKKSAVQSIWHLVQATLKPAERMNPTSLGYHKEYEGKF